MTGRFADPGAGADGLIGGWALVSYAAGDDGSAPLGPRPAGLLSYTRDGAMSAHLVPSDVSASGTGPRYIAYFGAFSTAGDTVVHHVHAATDPALAGRDLVRDVTLRGDTLALTATINGSAHVLTWRRVGTDGS